MSKTKSSVVRNDLLSDKMTPKEKKKSIVMLIAGAIAIIIAIASFTVAFRQILHRDPGYYAVETNEDDSAKIYASGISFTYYYEGSSAEIRTRQAELKNAYSSALVRIYKLLDPDKTYPSFINIAYINQHRGEDITLDEDLFNILRSAYELTEQGRFDLFGGALYREWQDIRVLDDSSDFDPLTNPDMAERISSIVKLISDRSNFSFRIVDEAKHIINFSVSDKYEAFEAENELAPCLNLGSLKVAYELDHVCDKLEKAGFNMGYFTTSTDLSLAMSGVNDGSYVIYGLKGDNPTQAATIKMEPNSACAAYRSFDFEDAIEYYVIETENGPERRHPHFSMDTGEIYDELSSVCVVSYNGSAVDACLAAEMLFGSKSAAEAADAAKGIASKDMLIAYIKAEDPMTIFADSANAGRVELVSGSEFSVKTY